VHSLLDPESVSLSCRRWWSAEGSNKAQWEEWEACTAACRAAIGKVAFRDCLAANHVLGLCTAWHSQELVGMVAFNRLSRDDTAAEVQHQREDDAAAEVTAFIMPAFTRRECGIVLLECALRHVAMTKPGCLCVKPGCLPHFDSHFDWKEGAARSEDEGSQELCRIRGAVTEKGKWIWSITYQDQDTTTLELQQNDELQQNGAHQNDRIELVLKQQERRDQRQQPQVNLKGCHPCHQMMQSHMPDRNWNFILLPTLPTAGLGAGCCHCKHFRQQQQSDAQKLLSSKQWDLLQAMWYGIMHNANIVLLHQRRWCSDEQVDRWADEKASSHAFEPLFQLCRAASNAIVGPALKKAGINEVVAQQTLEYVAEQHIVVLKRHFVALLQYVKMERDDMKTLRKICDATDKKEQNRSDDVDHLLQTVQLSGKRLRDAHSAQVWAYWNFLFKKNRDPGANNTGFLDHRRLDRHMTKTKSRCCRKWTPYGADARDVENNGVETRGKERRLSRLRWHKETGKETVLRKACLHMVRTIHVSKEFAEYTSGDVNDAAARLIALLLKSVEVNSWETSAPQDGFSCFFGLQPGAGSTLTCIHRNGPAVRCDRHRYNSPCAICGCDSILWFRLGAQNFNTAQESDPLSLNSWTEKGLGNVRTLHPSSLHTNSSTLHHG
jgi:hypothetical protein